MKLFRVGRYALLGAFSLGLAACGSDSTGPDDELTDAEVEALFEAFSMVGMDLDMAGFTGGGPVAAPLVSETVPCPQGGAVKVTMVGFDDSGFDPHTQIGTISMDLTYDYEACKATAPASGMQFTFNGKPNIAIAMTMTITESGFEIAGSQKGGIEWLTGSRSGQCAMDVEFDLSADMEGEPTGTVSGTLCGRSLSESV